MLSNISSLSTLCAGFALAASLAAAQTASDDGGLSTGEALAPDGEPVGSVYVDDEFGDWQKRCVRTAEGNDPCQLYQLIGDQNGASVAEITIFALPEGQAAPAGATIVTPLETLLTEQLTLSVDDGAGKRYPFRFCAQQGCVSRIGLLEEDLTAFRAGNTARLRIVPAVAPDQEVLLDISLTGFTAGFSSLSE